MEKKIDKFYYQELGQKIHFERIKKGYSLRYLSKETGLSRTLLDDYELGRRRISNDNWKSICKALNINQKIMINIAIG